MAHRESRLDNTTPRACGMALIMVALAAACAPAAWQRPMKFGTVDTSSGSLSEARTYLEGRWMLLSWWLFRAGTRGVISVAGRTVVDRGSRTITFVLDGEPLIVPEAGPLSSRHPRHWEVDGNVLTLTTRNDYGEALLESRWQELL